MVVGLLIEVIVLWLVVLLDVVIVQWTGLLVVVVFVLLFWTYYFVCGCCEGVCGLLCNNLPMVGRL